jgi:lysophospholipase L1-like esterase
MGFLGTLMLRAVALALLVGSTGFFALRSFHTFSAKGPRVLFIGDSVVGGKMDETPKRGMLGRLPDALPGAEVEGISLPGATTSGLLAYLQHQLDPHRRTELKSRLRNADVVIISGGLNDFWAETGPRRTVANLRAMAKMVACASTEIRVSRPHISLATLIPTTLHAQQNWANAVNKLLLGLPTSFSVTGPRFHEMDIKLLSDDGLHPSGRGYDWLTLRSTKTVADLMASSVVEAVDCSASNASVNALPSHDGFPNQGKRRKNRRPAVPSSNEAGPATQRRVAAKEVGVAYFSILSPHFPCAQALSVFETGAGPALATLWGTFGKDTRCLAEWFKTAPEKPHTLEIHPWNGPCIRNKRCESDEIGAGLSIKEFNRKLEQGDEQLIRAITERIREIKAAVEKLARHSDELILSTGLEDNYSPAAFENVLRVLKEHWPYKIVRNPVGDLKNKEYTGADYLELHGSDPMFGPEDRCIANLDGTDINFPHRAGVDPQPISWQKAKEYVERYSKQCRLTYVWSGAWQGLFGRSFQPPSARSFKVEQRDVEMVKQLLENR